MIELVNVSKSYRKGSGWNRVLRDISVTFPTGHSVGILGLNGAGKSTLLRLIGGVEPPDTGIVRRDITVSWPLGFSGGFQGSLTGRENTRFIARIYGAPEGEIERYVQAFAELGDYFDMPISSYSSGMRARLSFSVSMATDFQCYLVDEITAAGDERFQMKYRQAFVERKKRSTMIMVSHSEMTIRKYCDMAAVLHEGHLELYETVREAVMVYKNITYSLET